MHHVKSDGEQSGEVSADLLVNRATCEAGATRRTVVLMLFFGAAAIWFWMPGFRLNAPRMTVGGWSVWGDLKIQLYIIVGSIIIALLPSARRAVLHGLNRLRHPSPSTRRWTALALAIVAGVYCYATAVRQGRVLLPTWHDEEAYRLQTQMLAHGRLWMPEHQLAQFFEAFYVFVRPVYAAKYFPGTAMLNVPGVWLHLPYCVIPLIIAGACVGLLYLVITEVLDGVAGLLAALLLVSVPVFRQLAIMEMANMPALLFALLIFWSWLRWRGSMRLGWALLAGAATGWLAITRPIDALSAAGPVAVFWMIDLYVASKRGNALDQPGETARPRAVPPCETPIRHLSPRRATLTVALALLATLPFLAIQLIFDKGVAGSYLRTPVGVYDAHYFQSPGLGFPPQDEQFVPPTHLLQFRSMYKKLFWPQMKGYTPPEAIWQLWSRRLPIAASSLLPSSLLVLLWAVGLLGLRRDRRRMALFLMMPAFLGLMIFYFFFMSHYCLLFAGSGILLILVGSRVIERRWPWRRVLSAAMPIAIAGLAILSFPEVNRAPDEIPNSVPIMRANYTLIPKEVRTPAIVLFTYNTYWDYEEPVYNWSVVWPDDAAIIRAHDLGPAENQELYRYYAARQPDRNVYIFNRAQRTIRSLGKVGALAVKVPSTLPDQ